MHTRERADSTEQHDIDLEASDEVKSECVVFSISSWSGASEAENPSEMLNVAIAVLRKLYKFKLGQSTTLRGLSRRIWSVRASLPEACGDANVLRS